MADDGLTLLDNLAIKYEWFNRLLGFFTWTLGRRVRWIACFVFGHDVEDGERVYDGTGYSMKITDDFCNRCWHSADEMDLDWQPITMPYFLHRAYVWLVEKNWPWFNVVDEYVWGHNIKMPRWWSY